MNYKGSEIIVVFYGHSVFYQLTEPRSITVSMLGSAIFSLYVQKESPCSQRLWIIALE